MTHLATDVAEAHELRELEARHGKGEVQMDEYLKVLGYGA